MSSRSGKVQGASPEYMRSLGESDTWPLSVWCGAHVGTTPSAWIVSWSMAYSQYPGASFGPANPFESQAGNPGGRPCKYMTTTLPGTTGGQAAPPHEYVDEPS